MKSINCIVIILIVGLLIGCKNTMKEIPVERFLLPEGAEYIQLIDTGTFDSPYLFRSLPNGKMAFIYNGYCTIVEDSAHNLINLSVRHQPTDIHWDPSKFCLFSDSTCIYSIDSLGHTKVFIDTRKKNTRFAFNQTTGVYYYHEQDTVLYCFSYKHKNFIPLFTSSSAINDFKLEGDDIYLATGKEILLIRNDNKIYPLYTASDSIRSVELGGNGSIFYATDHQVGYFDYKRNQFILMRKGAKDLQRNNNSLYITFTDNSSARIDSISTYCVLSDSLSILKKIKP